MTLNPTFCFQYPNEQMKPSHCKMITKVEGTEHKLTLFLQVLFYWEVLPSSMAYVRVIDRRWQISLRLFKINYNCLHGDL